MRQKRVQERQQRIHVIARSLLPCLAPADHHGPGDWPFSVRWLSATLLSVCIGTCSRVSFSTRTSTVSPSRARYAPWVVTYKVLGSAFIYRPLIAAVAVGVMPSVAHALLRAASALKPTLGWPRIR